MSAGRWFRVYDSLLNDPKVQRLPPKLFKGLINLWCYASQHNGIVTEDEKELSFVLRTSVKRAKEIQFSLFALGFFDKTPDGMTPHNWQERQRPSDNSAAIKRAYREKSKDMSKECPPLEKSRVDKIREEKRVRRDAPNGAAPPKALSNWNSAARQLTLAPARDMTPDRKKKLHAILEKYGIEGWNQALQNIADMPFCCGENDRSWRVTIDWLLKPSNFVKILEKTYEKPPNDGGSTNGVQ